MTTDWLSHRLNPTGSQTTKETSWWRLQKSASQGTQQVCSGKAWSWGDKGSYLLSPWFGLPTPTPHDLPKEKHMPPTEGTYKFSTAIVMSNVHLDIIPLKTSNFGAPGWLHQLSASSWFWLRSQSHSLWVGAPRWAPQLAAQSMLGILSVSLSPCTSPTYAISVSLK